jgi:uncharacterized membrane protein YphA (DoxX/SURF4 family)
MSAIPSFLTTRPAIRIAQVVIGVLLISAALAKLGDVKTFALQVHNFRILPIALENLVAMTLPWVELLAGLSLTLGVRPRSGGWVATTLLAAFTLAVTAALARGLDFECGCFGTADSTRVGGAKIAQNVGMLAVAALSVVRPKA